MKYLNSIFNTDNLSKIYSIFEKYTASDHERNKVLQQITDLSKPKFFILSLGYNCQGKFSSGVNLFVNEDK